MEIAIVLIIALVIFGPKKLPELGHGMGKGMREFKRSVTGEADRGLPGGESVPAAETSVEEEPAVR